MSDSKKTTQAAAKVAPKAQEAAVEAKSTVAATAAKTKETLSDAAATVATKATKAKETVTEAAASVSTSATKTKETLSVAASALNTSASAYVAGVTELAKAVYGIGQEVAQETVEHGKTSMKANCVKNLAELQAGYVQHRIEASSVHMKTVADIAGENLKNVYAPLIGLLSERKAA